VLPVQIATSYLSMSYMEVVLFRKVRKMVPVRSDHKEGHYGTAPPDLYMDEIACYEIRPYSLKPASFLFLLIIIKISIHLE